MSRRPLKKYDMETATHKQRIYRDTDWNEFVVVTRCKANGNRVSSYHTDSEADAVGTGIRELHDCTQNNATEEVPD